MKFSRSLAASITLTLTLGLTIVMALSTLFMNSEIRREIHDIIARKNGLILDLQADNAALSLWDFDSKQLQSIVNSIARDESVHRAEITGSEGGIDVSAVHPGDAADDAPFGTPLEREILFQDHGSTRHLGRLTVVPNYSDVTDRLRRFAVRLTAGVGLLLALLVAAVYAVTRRAIAPVTQLSASMAASSSDAPPIRAAESRVVEVQRLFQALQQMQGNYLKHQKELVAEKEKAEQANRVKSDFLAIMSHELRTPLNSITGLANMFIQDTSLDAEHHEMAVIIRKSSLVLLSIINDILDISKIESGNLKLEETDFDPLEAVSGILQPLLLIASSKGLVLKSERLRQDFPAFVRGDPLRFGRILTNLVSNAIKYTEKGFVQVSVDFTPLGTTGIELLCKVTDTGIGIPRDKLDRIFDKFTQADESTTRKYGGTGLGLAISRELVGIMGGKIGVESLVGAGSAFWFSIPFEISDGNRGEASGTDWKKQSFVISAARKNVAETKVLLAEDHLLNQVFMKKLLGRMGFRHIDIRENGQLALQSFIEGGHDLVFMDCHMPLLNGYDATRAIRAHEREKGGHVHILAMTADAMVGTREKCLEAGMDSYISKPVDSDELKAILGQWVIFDGQAETQETAAESAGRGEDLPPCVDLSALRNYADTPEESRAFVDAFSNQSEADLKALRAACVDGESKAWRETAHKLKGGSGVAGAFVMRELCSEAQEMLVATAAERQAKCREIEAAFEAAKAFFQKVLS